MASKPSRLPALCSGGYFVADLNQAAQYRILAHDVRVSLGVDRGRRIVGENTEVSEAADGVEFSARTEPFRYGDDVIRLAVFGERPDCPEDQAVIMPVEILLVDDIGDAPIAPPPASVAGP